MSLTGRFALEKKKEKPHVVQKLVQKFESTENIDGPLKEDNPSYIKSGLLVNMFSFWSDKLNKTDNVSAAEDGVKLRERKFVTSNSNIKEISTKHIPAKTAQVKTNYVKQISQQFEKRCETEARNSVVRQSYNFSKRSSVSEDKFKNNNGGKLRENRLENNKILEEELPEDAHKAKPKLRPAVGPKPTVKADTNKISKVMHSIQNISKVFMNDCERSDKSSKNSKSVHLKKLEKDLTDSSYDLKKDVQVKRNSSKKNKNKRNSFGSANEYVSDDDAKVKTETNNLERSEDAAVSNEDFRNEHDTINNGCKCINEYVDGYQLNKEKSKKLIRNFYDGKWGKNKTGMVANVTLAEKLGQYEKLRQNEKSKQSETLDKIKLEENQKFEENKKLEEYDKSKENEKLEETEKLDKNQKSEEIADLEQTEKLENEKLREYDKLKENKIKWVGNKNDYRQRVNISQSRSDIECSLLKSSQKMKCKTTITKKTAINEQTTNKDETTIEHEAPRDESKKDKAKKDSTKRDEAITGDTAKAEANEDEANKEEDANDKANNHETTKHKANTDELTKDKANRDEAAKDNANNNEANTDEFIKDEANNEATKKERNTDLTYKVKMTTDKATINNEIAIKEETKFDYEHVEKEDGSSNKRRYVRHISRINSKEIAKKEQNKVERNKNLSLIEKIIASEKTTPQEEVEYSTDIREQNHDSEEKDQITTKKRGNNINNEVNKPNIKEQNQILEKQDKKIKVRDQLIEKQNQNIGKSDQDIEKKQDQHIVKQDQNIGKQDQNIYKQDQNIDKPDQNIDKQNQNMETPVQNMQLKDNINETQQHYMEVVDQNIHTSQKYQNESSKTEESIKNVQKALPENMQNANKVTDTVQQISPVAIKRKSNKDIIEAFRLKTKSVILQDLEDMLVDSDILEKFQRDFNMSKQEASRFDFPLEENNFYETLNSYSSENFESLETLNGSYNRDSNSPSKDSCEEDILLRNTSSNKYERTSGRIMKETFYDEDEIPRIERVSKIPENYPLLTEVISPEIYTSQFLSSSSGKPR